MLTVSCWSLKCLSVPVTHSEAHLQSWLTLLPPKETPASLWGLCLWPSCPPLLSLCLSVALSLSSSISTPLSFGSMNSQQVYELFFFSQDIQIQLWTFLTLGLCSNTPCPPATVVTTCSTHAVLGTQSPVCRHTSQVTPTAELQITAGFLQTKT